ncbi:hypothetical protein MPLDJ20_310025 [Mesorhizobium plurifarium]|uniref:Uncharacterized protein n=1 Tax=Mesorhizobium plurifarium TaxID=69974 RepID=A0A090FH11_MESPL|nr:hypothetical protein MPLDJ20_310025 [Mesorhizobium plurifarium]
MVAANRRNGLASLLVASRGHPRTALPTVASVVITVAALYFGREVFLPIAGAVLLAFAIAQSFHGSNASAFPAWPRSSPASPAPLQRSRCSPSSSPPKSAISRRTLPSTRSTS